MTLFWYEFRVSGFLGNFYCFTQTVLNTLFQRWLYSSGNVTSAMRLLHAQVPMEDDRKLCEYSLPEGAIISALFETDVDINIQVNMGHQKQKLTVSSNTSVKVLKFQICGVLRCGVVPEKLEIKLGDVTLEDPMPLHFYGIKDESALNIFKQYINVTVQNNRGETLSWRLDRKDSIKEVKSELAAVHSLSPIKFYLYCPTSLYPNIPMRSHSSMFTEIRGFHGAGLTVKSMRLYRVTKDGEYDEMDDDKTVEDYKIQDGDGLFLLTYTWERNEVQVTVRETSGKLQGVQQDDTCLGIKVRAQDQLGIPVNTLKLVDSYAKVHDDDVKPIRGETRELRIVTEEEYQKYYVRKY